MQKNSLDPCSFLLIVELKPFSSEVHPNCVSDWCCRFLILLSLSGNPTFGTFIVVLFLYHRSCKMLFYIPVSQTVEVRRATFCLIWILTFPESPRSTFWKLFPGQSAALISICHSILTFSLLAHFSTPFPVICENRKPFPVLTKSLCCAGSNFCGRQLSHLRLASCRLVSVL